MFAVVLVGGFGTRLRPLTNEIPKPMLPVVHRPMIVRLVERLGPAGVTDVVLALGFKPGPFEAAFPDGFLDDVRIHYAVEPEPLDTAGAIAFAARWAAIDDTFIVANGDVMSDLNFGDLVAAHRAVGVDATIHLTPVDDPSAFGVVEINSSGIVERFLEKPSPGETDSNLINAGTYVFEPKVLDLIEPGIRVSIERATFPLLVAGGQLAGYATDSYWIDTGRPEFFLQANLDLISGLRQPVESGIAVGAMIHPEAIVVQSVVASDVVVESGTTITESVLLPGAHVEARAAVEGSIVAGRVAAGATVRSSVIGAGFTISEGATVLGERLPTPD